MYITELTNVFECGGANYCLARRTDGIENCHLSFDRTLMRTSTKKNSDCKPFRTPKASNEIATFLGLRWWSSYTRTDKSRIT